MYVKLENFNLSRNVKDRAALAMIEEAEKNGLLIKGNTIVEPTSWNTSISIAMIGKLKGYKVIIIMPETMSKERTDIIQVYGAELILTEASKGAIEKAEELVNNHGYFMPQQFMNKAPPKKHYDSTAEEI